MNVLKTFRRGGIHPPENKLSARKEIETLPLPDQVAIPLNQHIGAPAIPVVEKGDSVKVGTLIGKANGFISANIHSSVSGKVLKIDNVYDTSGYKKPAVIIKVEDDIWEESIVRDDKLDKECNLPPKEIVDKITEAGIVGMGGAAFPTHVKLSIPPGEKASVLLINASECEPYLTDDHALMLAKTEEIMIGIRLLMRAIEVDTAYIGIENNKRDAIERFSNIIPQYPGIHLAPLKVKYPQGGEKQLIEAIMKKEVPSGKLPVHVGAVVQNVGTTFAVYEAVLKNKPLIDRIVTVTGKTLGKQMDVRVRVGTPIRHLIEYAGGLPEDTGKIIGGGPMMGRALVSQDIPVVKGMSGILILPHTESFRKDSRPCIRCSKCVSICPMGLVPSFLMNCVEFEDFDRAEKFHITDCIECGSCFYVCPSNRPLSDYIRNGKAKVLSIIRKR